LTGSEDIVDRDEIRAVVTAKALYNVIYEVKSSRIMPFIIEITVIVPRKKNL